MYSLGTIPFSSDSDWNQTITSDATYTKLNWPASTGYNYSVNWDHYSPALYVASPSDPLVQIKVPASWGHPGGTISVRMPLDATGAVGTDGELLIVDGDKVYNFWQFDRTSATSATAASYGWTDVVTGTGWGSKTPFLGAGTTAVGASQLGGLLVEAETDAGAINHALQLVVDSKLVKSGITGSAISSDGGSASGIVREGDHLGIPPGTPMPAGLSPLGQQVFTAMQQYGAYVVDVAGGATVIRAQANAYDSATMSALWRDMGSITPLLQQVANGTASTQTPGTTTPEPAILSTIAASGAGISNGDGNLSSGTVQLGLAFDKAVNVSGTPTLTLNDGGVATYKSGSGTRNLVFDYQIGAGQNTSDLAVTSFNLSGVKDAAGNSVNLTGAPTNPAGTLRIDTRAATLTSIGASGDGITNGSGVLNNGTVRLSLAFDEAVKVNGTPSLTLNNGGIATYVSGSGTRNLAFDYQVATGQNSADLAVSAYNLSSVRDLAGNALNLANAPTNPSGTLKIDTASPPSTTDPTEPPVTTPPVTAPPVTTPPSTVDSTVPTVEGVDVTRSGSRSGTITLIMSEDVVVNGSPWLRLKDGSKAIYQGGSGSNTLTFAYESYKGSKNSAPSIFGMVLPSSSSITDAAGNEADLSGAGTAKQYGRGKFSISGTTELELFSRNKERVSFEEGASGALTLNAASKFKGSVDGFCGENTMKLSDIAFGENTTLAYKPNNSNTRGKLVVSDGEHTAKIQLLGQYSASSFSMSAGQTGGTTIHDAFASSLAPTLTKSS